MERDVQTRGWNVRSGAEILALPSPFHHIPVFCLPGEVLALAPLSTTRLPYEALALLLFPPHILVKDQLYRDDGQNQTQPRSPSKNSAIGPH